MLPFAYALSAFRDKIRTLAQNKAGNYIHVDPKEILKLCDILRDEDMVELGVALEDREDGKALVKLVDKQVLLDQRQAKLDRELQKKKEKEERLKAEALKKQERLLKGKTAPSDLFKTIEFSAWDEKGIPTKDKEGNEVAKSRRKKLEKEYAIQEKLHAEYLASLQ